METLIIYNAWKLVVSSSSHDANRAKLGRKLDVTFADYTPALLASLLAQKRTQIVSV